MHSIISSTERIKDGTVILEEGTWALHAYVLQDGTATVWKKVEGQPVLIGRLKKGDIFGEMAFLGEVKRTATVIAEGDVDVGVIPRENFVRAFDRLPDELREKLNGIVRNLASLDSVYGQLATCLQSVQSLSGCTVDVKQLASEIDQMPELLRQMVIQIARRLNVAIEGCVHLAAQIEQAGKAVDSLSIAIMPVQNKPKR